MNIKKCPPLECRHGDVCPLVYAIVNNALITPAHTSIRCYPDHSHPVLLPGRQVAPVFVVNWIDVRAIWWPQICKFIRMSMIS